MVKIEDYNESYILVSGSLDENMKIKRHFTYKNPKIRFSKMYKMGLIKDTVTFYNKNRLPKGLYSELINFLNKNSIPYEDKVNIMSNFIYIDYEKFIPDGLDLYPHQKEIIENTIKKSRMVFESATSSGKSLSIYIIQRILVENGLKVIIVVPTIMLANQIYKDFKDYGSIENVIKINSKERHKDVEQAIEDSNVIIITKKSLPIYFDILKNSYDAIMVDECLDGNSMITMSDGSQKKIIECNIGDKILSYNIDKKIFEEDVIEKVYKNISNEDMYELELDNGDILKITGNHKVLTKRGWVRVDNLTIEDDIIDYL